MTEYLSEEQIEALERYANEKGSWSLVGDFIKKYSEPKYEDGVVYSVSVRIGAGTADEFLKWNAPRGTFENASGDSLCNILMDSWGYYHFTDSDIIKAEKVNQ